MIKYNSLILLVFLFSILLPAYSHGVENDAYKLYQQVISGQKKIDDLTPEQKRIVITIQKSLNRSTCDGCSEECREAKEQAENYRSDLESYSKRLYNCVESNDLTDDCYSEFRRVKSAHSDFESAVSNVTSSCN